MSNKKTMITSQADPDPSSLPTSNDNAQTGLLSRAGHKIAAKLGKGSSLSPRQQITDLLRSSSTSPRNGFSRQERSMLRNILRFDSLRVDDVMVPRADIIAIDEQASLGELFALFESSAHSRIPLYRETLDDPRGMVHIKDLMLWITNRSTAEQHVGKIHGKASLRLVESRKEILSLTDIDLNETIASIKIGRSMLYVPPSMPILDLLLRMQSTRTHLALVVDEYGGTDGLVSIEDLVEEVVGEIEDEHDAEEGSTLTNHPKQGLLANARTAIEELELHLGYDLVSDEEDDDINTLGGLVFALAQRVPVPGEFVAHPSGLEFEVLDADPRRIKKLRIHIPEEMPEMPEKPDQSGPLIVDAGE